MINATSREQGTAVWRTCRPVTFEDFGAADRSDPLPSVHAKVVQIVVPTIGQPQQIFDHGLRRARGDCRVKQILPRHRTGRKQCTSHPHDGTTVALIHSDPVHEPERPYSVSGTAMQSSANLFGPLSLLPPPMIDTTTPRDSLIILPAATHTGRFRS